MPVNAAAQKRPLSKIAEDIQENWTKPYFGAEPYIEAMSRLTLITDPYFDDSAESVVRRFLVNAGSWRGETARSVKAELRAMTP